MTLFWGKYLTALAMNYCHKKAPSKMFDRVLILLCDITKIKMTFSLNKIKGNLDLHHKVKNLLK